MGYSPWDQKRIRHDLATKQQQEYRALKKKKSESVSHSFFCVVWSIFEPFNILTKIQLKT